MNRYRFAWWWGLAVVLLLSGCASTSPNSGWEWLTKVEEFVRGTCPNPAVAATARSAAGVEEALTATATMRDVGRFSSKPVETTWTFDPQSQQWTRELADGTTAILVGKALRLLIEEWTKFCASVNESQGAVASLERARARLAVESQALPVEQPTVTEEALRLLELMARARAAEKPCPGGEGDNC